MLIFIRFIPILLLLTLVTTLSASPFSASTKTGQTKSKSTVQVQVSVGLTVPKSKLLSATNAVSSKNAVDEDIAVQLSKHMNWEKLLSPAPLSIGLLGDLMIMSSKTRDFPIDGELPKVGKILYVKYPHSFRATLVQIANGGHRAFLVAHTNMDKIKLLMGDIPAYMKEATEILVQGDEEVVRDFLPAPMDRIREAARSSVALSMAVVWQFENVMNLTSEVLELCTSEKSIQESKLQTNIDRQKILNFTIPSYQQMVSQLNETMARDTEMMDRAEKDMRKALKDMPSGWEMIGMDLVQNMGDMLTVALKQRLNPLGKATVLIDQGLKIADKFTINGKDKDGFLDQKTEYNGTDSDPTVNGEPCIIQHKREVLSMEGLASHMRTTYTDLTSIDSAKKGKYDPRDDSQKLTKILMKVEECNPVANVAKQGLDFNKKLAKIVQGRKAENVTEQEFTERRQLDFDQALDIVIDFKTSASRMKKWILSNQQTIPNKTPLLSRAQGANAKGSASQQAMAACRFRAEMAQATLVNTRQSIDKTRAMMIEQNNEFIKLLTEQQGLKLDEVRYDEIIKALQEGIKKLAILKEHWTMLVMFFNQIANFVENVAAKSAEDFANHIETTSLQLKNIHKQFVMDQLYLKATKAAQASSVVHNMAETYMKVSTKYIMPSVASLGKLIVADPQTADADREALLAKCTDDSYAIIDLIIADKNVIVQKIDKRMKDFKREFAFLDEVRRNQIADITRKEERKIESELKKTKKKISATEKTKRVKEAVHIKIEKDEFLRESNILNFVEADGAIDADEY